MATMAMPQRLAAEAARGALLATHAATGLTVGASPQAARLLRAAEGILRSAIAVLASPPAPAAVQPTVASPAPPRRRRPRARRGNKGNAKDNLDGGANTDVKKGIDGDEAMVGDDGAVTAPGVLSGSGAAWFGGSGVGACRAAAEAAVFVAGPAQGLGADSAAPPLPPTMVVPASCAAAVATGTAPPIIEASGGLGTGGVDPGLASLARALAQASEMLARASALALERVLAASAFSSLRRPSFVRKWSVWVALIASMGRPAASCFCRNRPVWTISLWRVSAFMVHK